MKKQQIKSQQTRSNIMQAAAVLFTTNGYNETSVADIVAKADCSVGAFYGHFKSKEALVTRIWLDETIATIKESVEKGSRITDREAFIDYLIARSNLSAENLIMSRLLFYCQINEESRAELAKYATRYLSMIRNMLYTYAPEASEETLWTYASIIHNLLNAHSQKNSGQNGYFQFDDNVVKTAILTMMDACKGEKNILKSE